MIKRSLFPPFLLLSGLVVLLLIPFSQPGVAGSDDILVTIYRVFALRQSWDAGILYPRVAPDLAFGYGAPLFQYYPPLSTYLAALFTLTGLGMVDAVKVTFAATLLFAGIGTFLYARSWFNSSAAGWLAAVIYVAAPYQIANSYVRGATAEALGMALLPWILWAVRLLFRSTRLLFWFSWLSLLLAGLLVSHNALSLFFLPILLLVCLLDGWQLGKWRQLLLCAAAILLALAISAFFWLPALLERDQVNIAAMTAGHYDPLTHLKPLGEVIQQTGTFQYDRPQVYSFGWLPLGLSLIAALLIGWRRTKQSLWIGLALLLVIVPLFLQLPAAAPFWRDLPLVRFIQFPWRLFAFASLAAAMLIGALPALTKNRRSEWAVALAVGVLMIGYAFLNLPTMYAGELARGSFTNENVNHGDLYERGQLGFELFSDYQPTTVQIAMNDIPNNPTETPATSALSAYLPAIQLQTYHGLTLRAALQSEQESTLLLNRFFLPGWQASLNGNPIAVEPLGDLGLSFVKIPPGQHELVVQFGTTPLRNWATWLSLICFVLWRIVFEVGRGRTYAQAIPTGYVAAIVLLIAMFVPSMWADSTTANAVHSLQAQVGNGDLIGYSLDQAIYRPDDTIKLTLYWRCAQFTNRESKVFVHLRDLNDTQMIAQHDGAPGYGFTPTTRWQPGEIIDDVHPLELADTVVAGTYQLAVGMYDPVTITNLPVQAEKTLTGERIVLGTLEVR